MNDILDIPSSLLTELLNLGPEMLMILFVMALGYALKIVDVVPNKRIPLILLLAVCILYPVLAEHGPLESEIATTKGPLARALVRNEIVAVVLWMIAWMIHSKAIAKLEDKFGWFDSKPNQPKLPIKPAEGQPPTS